MKARRLLFLAAMLSLAAGTVGVIARAQPAARPAEAPSTQPVAVNHFCPVDSENEIDPTLTIQHDGKRIGFCCAECIPAFRANPQKFVRTMH